MMTYPDIVKTKLDAAITQAIACRGEYINTLASFTRQRKLPMETVIKLLLSMQGGSLNKELHDSGIGVTASAFVQQRAKVSSGVFHDILQGFNAAHDDPKTFRGYRILAVDGTYINMARNPNSESFVCNDSNPEGYNQLHLNPLYDILNRVYFDCVMQEIYSSMIMYNFCNRISGEVVIQQRKENVYAYKVNLKMAIYLCKEFYRNPQGDAEKLMRDIGRYTEPVRPGRRDERNIKAKSFVGFTYRVAA